MLVVDDDVASANALRELLHQEGAKVQAVYSAAEAVKITEQYGFDVVLSDIAMPDMDGHALLRKLRENPRYAHLPVIACTGFDCNRDAESALQSGFDAQLGKPLDLQSVITTIKSVIGGSKPH